MAEKLTPKQLKFCNEYLIDLNGSASAVRAGYSKKGSNVQASLLLSNINIQHKIAELQKKLQDKCNITAESVINELAKIGFSNIQDFVNGGNSILELKYLDRNKVAAVSSIKTTIKLDGDVQSEIRFHSKVAALERLGEHLGIFDKEGKLKDIPAPIININMPK